MLNGSGAKGFAAQPGAARGLADEGQVVVTARGVRNGGATVGRDTEIGQVPDVSAVDSDRTRGIADTDGVAGIAAAVDVANTDRATIRGRGGDPTVPAEATSVGPSSPPPKNLS